MRRACSEGRARRIPSQADIAIAARVSTATVSRVVNNSGLVKTALRERVLTEMQRLGYYPNGVARALANNRSWTIGAVVPTLDSDLFARGVDALMRHLRDLDYSLVVVSSDYSLTAETQLVQRLLERGIDGLFLVGQERSAETERLLEHSDCPYVETYICDRSERDHHIGFSNIEAGATLVDHLVGLGHKHIGMLSGLTAGNDRARGRLRGFRERMAAHALPVDESQVIEIPFDIDAARAAFVRILAAERPPTALVCGNDLIAMGALFEAQARSFAVPARMSIVGIDNHPLSRHAWPPLTTIGIPASDIGKLAARALVDAIDKGSPIMRRALAAPLVVRATTAPPPGGD